MSTAIVVLAAGASTRLGRPKQLVEFRGRPLVVHAVEVALAAACGPVWVAVGAGAEAIAPVLAQYPVRLVRVPGWAAGLGTTIATAIRAVGCTPATAALLALCDQPGLGAAHLRALAARPDPRPIAASAYAGTLGVPARFDARVFPELAALDGPAGARAVIARDPARVRAVPFAAGGWDVDTPADLARLSAVQDFPNS